MTQNAISASTPLAEAFADGGSHARIVVHDKRVAGLLTMRCVLQAWLKHRTFDKLTAGDVMSEKVVTLTASNNNLHVARLFAGHHIKSIAITDADGLFLSTMDPQDLIPQLPSSLLAFFLPASQVMIRSPHTILPETTILESIEKLVARGISCLIVCEEEAPVGMLSESDMLRAVLNGDDLNAPVTGIMSAPLSTMSESSNLRQIWEMMDSNRIMKTVLTDASGHLSGLITATDVLVALCQGLLNTFSVYHCPEETDLMAEWRKSGLIMAASDTLLGCLGLNSEELIGLRWQDGFSEEAIDKMLALPKNETMDVFWQFDETVLPFTVSRDLEHAAMWWKLKF